MTPETAAGKSLVLVTGAARSGTSTIAGTLSYLGFHVPLPVVPTNESNPRGFFESTWPLWFHRAIMARAVIEQADGRPQALGLVDASVDDATRTELREWLAGTMQAADDVVVKDPRATWVPLLWAQAAEAVGTRIGFVTMLRHPAEVIGSRSTYYRDYRPWMEPWGFSVMHLCGWINGNLVIERQTRDLRRVFLPYDELTGDWRTAMRGVRDVLGLRLNHPLDPDLPHRVDEFIEPGLNRHRVTFAEMGLPAELTDIAEDVWRALMSLAKGQGHDPVAESELDRLADRYAGIYRTAAAISVDAATARMRVQRKKAVDEVETRLRAEIDLGRQQVDVLQKQVQQLEERQRRPALATRAYRSLRRRARGLLQR